MDVVIEKDEINILRMTLGPWATNSYIVIYPQTGDSALIDVPPGPEPIIQNLQGTNLRYILLTHNHLDHVEGLPAIKDHVQAPLAVHPADSQKWLPYPPEILLKDRDIIKLGKIKIEVIYTPGHTPGSVCFRTGEYLFSGDTLFPGGPGRTETPSDFQQIFQSITEKILILPDETKIYPGHGESTILKKEKVEIESFTSHPLNPRLCGDVTWV